MRDEVMTVKPALTVREIAGKLNVSQPFVRMWIASGRLKALKLPGTKRQVTYRIEREDFEQFLRESR